MGKKTVNKKQTNQNRDIFSNPKSVKVQQGEEVIECSPEDVSQRIGRPFQDTIAIPCALNSQLNTACSKNDTPLLHNTVLKNREQMIIFSMGEAGYGIRTNASFQQGEAVLFYPGRIEERNLDLNRNEYTLMTQLVLENTLETMRYVINAEQHCGYGALLAFLPTSQMLNRYFIISKSLKDGVACANLGLNSSVVVSGVGIPFFYAQQALSKGAVLGFDYGINYFLQMLYLHTEMNRPPFMLFDDKRGTPIDFTHYLLKGLWILYRVGPRLDAITVSYKKILGAIHQNEPLILEYENQANAKRHMLVPVETLEKLFVNHVSTVNHIDLLIEFWNDARTMAEECSKELKQVKSNSGKIELANHHQLLQRYNAITSYTPSIQEQGQLIEIAQGLLKRTIQKEPPVSLEKEIHFDYTPSPVVSKGSMFNASKPNENIEIPRQIL